MSTPSKIKEGRTNGRKKRHSDEYRRQAPQTILATEFAVSLNGGNKNGNSDEHNKLAQKIISLVYNHESEEKLMEFISLLVEENAVSEMELLREEVQRLKDMLHNATNMLQDVSGNEVSRKSCAVQVGDMKNSQSSHEVYALKKRLQEEHKHEMDLLRQYFEKQCQQNQSDYVNEIYTLKLQSEKVEQQEAEISKLREEAEANVYHVKRLEVQNDDIMREKVHHEQANSQLHLTLTKMEQDKLAAEERTKKILSAVREGLHRLSDMKEENLAETSPGLTNFYNHVEEVITTDNWGDDETYVKGVMEEIQVSVQKLARPVRLPGRTSTDAQTEDLHTEIETVKETYESRISNLVESVNAEKKLLEQSLLDSQQKVSQLIQKSEADKRWIEEMSSEREGEREEMLKLTNLLEDSMRDNEKLQEKITNSQLAGDDLEAQVRQLSLQMDKLEGSRRRLSQDLQDKDEQLKQRGEIITDLENRLAEKCDQALGYQSQLERLKMELSGFLRSPPPSPEPPLDDVSFSLDDLFRQIMDLKDELESKYKAAEAERTKQVRSLQQELEQHKKNEEKIHFDRDNWQQQMESKDMELADIHRQLDDLRFGQPDADELENLQHRVRDLTTELQHCQQLISSQDTNLAEYRVENEYLRSSVEEWRRSCEQLKDQNSSVRDGLLARLEEFENQNISLLGKIEETATILDQQQKSWEDELHRKSESIVDLQDRLSECTSVIDQFESVKRNLEEAQQRLEQTETSLHDKTVQLQSFKNLIDIMKTESAQKDLVVKAVQKHGNDNSISLAEKLKETERLNISLMEEVDVLRNAPNRFNDYLASLREKDAEITHLRDLLESSFDEALRSPRKFTDATSESGVQTDVSITVPTIEGSVRGFLVESINKTTSREIQTDSSDDFEELLTRIANCNATIRELEHAIFQKDTQLNAMAVEIASLNDRHGKTQTKHRTTIRHLQSSSSSSDEGSPRSLPRPNLNNESKKLVAKYEEKIREMDKQHATELDRLVQESLQVLQNQSQNSTLLTDASSREASPANASMESSGDSTIIEGTLSKTLQRALRELRNGSEAILKASIQQSMNGSVKPDATASWPAERELLLTKVDYLRETINQLIISRDSLDNALRNLEQQNEELTAELDIFRKEDQMADQGKDLLLSLLKKTEAELAELQARYRQRDLRLEIEQAGREREEKEREKLQKELRDTEVQLVRVRGELRQKEAQWERERILTMWKKETNKIEMEESEISRSPWKGRYMRSESYRKNLIHQKRYLVTLIDDVIVNTNDEFVKMLALDGLRPATTRAPGAREWRRLSFRAAAVVVVATVRLRLTRISWAQRRNVG